MATKFASWGYVAFFVDDFAMRGIKETCAMDFKEGISDAYGALEFLSRLPYVDANRIAAIGYSQGADTALAIASSRFAPAFETPNSPKFKAAAAFYPPCENRANVKLEIPTLILIGESDSVTPAADCEQLAKQQSGGHPAVKLVIYPGASHGFDNPEFGNGVGLLGMTLKYDRSAAEQSWRETRDFLAANLGR